jgi:hypothetical protein
MGNTHVLDRIGPTRYRVAFHIAVPNGNNSASVSWANALKHSGQGGRTILPDGDGADGPISSAEKTAITNCTVYEHVGDIDMQGATGPARQALVDNAYNAAVTEVQAKLQAELGQFGRVL